MTSSIALISRELSDPVAYLSKALDVFGLASGIVDAKTFLRHVHALADSLPNKQFAINLCDNRYLFLVSFCAVIVKQQTNLLPSNKNVSTQEQLSEDYANTYIIHDEAIEISESISAINIQDIALNEGYKFNIPNIDKDHLACISFTSGSTGKPKPNLKYWHTLSVSTAINYEYMLPSTNETLYTLATMPAQHMWGLETSVLMAIFNKVCVCDAKPLFPQDIIDNLAALPEPRVLVSTPVHLRALTSNTAHNIKLHATLCATSPLTKQLAQIIESQFACPLHEVYGCSEVGSMAVRQTSKEESWLRFRNIDFVSEGGQTIASADHLPEKITLQDSLVLLDDNRFTLAGRSSDLVKIAGKRGSLFEINSVLLNFDGLQDGIIINPEGHADTKRLIAIVALNEDIEKSDLQRYLRKHLDNAFVPRPIYIVKSLPRESNGKLLKSKISDLLVNLRTTAIK